MGQANGQAPRATPPKPQARTAAGGAPRRSLHKSTVAKYSPRLDLRGLGCCVSAGCSRPLASSCKIVPPALPSSWNSSMSCEIALDPSQQVNPKLLTSGSRTIIAWHKIGSALWH